MLYSASGNDNDVQTIRRALHRGVRAGWRNAKHRAQWWTTLPIERSATPRVNPLRPAGNRRRAARSGDSTSKCHGSGAGRGYDVPSLDLTWPAGKAHLSTPNPGFKMSGLWHSFLLRSMI